jgi:hypothetical protein
MLTATATPAEVDIRIAEIMKIRGDIEIARMRAQYALDSKYDFDGIKARAAEQLEELDAREASLVTEQAELEGRYRIARWNRFWIVLNSNGHVHTSTACGTCFVDTAFGWLPQFSGTEQDEMGTLSGTDACAVCFPNLPAEVMQAKRDARVDTPERIADRETREAAAAERAARKAAKEAKAAAEAITSPDGTPLMDSIDYVVKREAQARSLYVEAAASALLAAEPESNYQGPLSDEEHAEICARSQARETADAARYLAALAHKADVTTEEMAAQLDKKVQAKYRSYRKAALAARARNA